MPFCHLTLVATNVINFTISLTGLLSQHRAKAIKTIKSVSKKITPSVENANLALGPDQANPRQRIIIWYVSHLQKKKTKKNKDCKSPGLASYGSVVDKK